MWAYLFALQHAFFLRHFARNRQPFVSLLKPRVEGLSIVLLLRGLISDFELMDRNTMQVNMYWPQWTIYVRDVPSFEAIYRVW